MNYMCLYLIIILLFTNKFIIHFSLLIILQKFAMKFDIRETRDLKKNWLVWPQNMIEKIKLHDQQKLNEDAIQFSFHLSLNKNIWWGNVLHAVNYFMMLVKITANYLQNCTSIQVHLNSRALYAIVDNKQLILSYLRKAVYRQFIFCFFSLHSRLYSGHFFACQIV